ARRRGPDREVSSGSWVPLVFAATATDRPPDSLSRTGPNRHDERVLLGWDSGVWLAVCLHLCLLQESTSSQNLAALRKEGSLGCVLQSCCHWNQAACCCGNRLRCDGLLRPVYKMNSEASISSSASQGDEGEEPVGSLGPA
ncbi:hypothetical protein JEQ12_000628, partial [Ovis aries]